METSEKAEDRAARQAGEDLGKGIRDLLCDIHTAHERWIDQWGPGNSNESRCILCAMAHTASMNAKVALSNEKLAKRMLLFTAAILVLTVLLVLVELV